MDLPMLDIVPGTAVVEGDHAAQSASSTTKPARGNYHLRGVPGGSLLHFTGLGIETPPN